MTPRTSTYFEIALKHVYWDQDKLFNEKWNSKISLDCPFKVIRNRSERELKVLGPGWGRDSSRR
jgi:hypothetical protein